MTPRIGSPGTSPPIGDPPLIHLRGRIGRTINKNICTGEELVILVRMGWRGGLPGKREPRDDGGGKRIMVRESVTVEMYGRETLILRAPTD